MIDRNRRLVDMTFGELVDFMQALTPRTAEAVPTPVRYVYGLKGLSEMLNCSKRTAERVKATGIIDPAITQVGRKIIIDADKAMELINKPKNIE